MRCRVGVSAMGQLRHFHESPLGDSEGAVCGVGAVSEGRRVGLCGAVGWGGDTRGPHTAHPAPQLPPQSSPLSFMDITALEMSCMASYGAPVFPYIAFGGYPGQWGCGVMWGDVGWCGVL